jgi:Zn-dependent M28 family amino/carboxypeptidase
MKIALFILTAASLCFGQIQEISGERIRAHTKFLASDLLEGRGVGTRGGDLATDYIATQFALIGAKPAGDNGTYFQRVPLVGVETVASDARLTAGSEKFAWGTEFVGTTARQQPQVDFDGDAIFVGHGITAPEFGWDDYKDIDVRGKVVVLFTNEPPSEDPNFFGGPALTYYGRWTYKYENATRHGALATIIVHTTPTAGYGWDVVKSSWGKEDPQVRLAPGAPALALAGWVTKDAGERLFKQAGHTVGEMLNMANTRGFRPVPLGFHIGGQVPSKIRDIESRNVAAKIEGSDPALKDEAVVFTAHWDHLGIGDPVDGDRIYNGAVDNATGCAMILEIARAWDMLPKKPRRSAIFLSVTAEEGGLRGSEYYAGHPIIPAAKTAVDLNFDAFYPFGRTSDTFVGGAERTTLWPLVQGVAKRMTLTIGSDPHPEQGHYYRSDHFSMARAGIPAFSISGGTHYHGKPADFAEKQFEEFNSKHYHQPSDEYHEDWDFSGMEQMARFGFEIGFEVANLDKLPSWRPGDEFLAAREASGVK